MMTTSKKRDVWIWSVFVLLGLLLFANGIFGIVNTGGFDCKFWAFAVLSSCAVFSCYFADKGKSAYVIYAGAAATQALLIADLYFENVILRFVICALSIGITIFLIIKYRNAEAKKIVERKRLTEPVFSQINKFNLFANMICVVGLLALLFAISENVIFRAATALLICLISLALTFIKQHYIKVAFGRKADIREYAFLAFWLIATLINSVILRDVRHALSYVAIVIMVLMTDYFIFDRPLVISRIADLAEVKDDA